MEVLSPQNQPSDDWQSLDESWDSRLPTPLALDFSSLRDDDDEVMSDTQRSYTNGNAEDFYPNGDGYQDQPATPDGQHVLTTSNGFTEGETEYLQMARKGGGHSDLLKVDPHTPTSEPVKYDKKDGQWYAHNGVDIQDTQQRKEMMTVPSRSQSSPDSSVDIETDTEYLKIAKKGGGHKDLLTVDPHTPTPEPVKYDKTDGQWYTHDGVDIKETQQRKDLSLALDGWELNGDAESAAGGKQTGYLDLAKKGGGHKDLLTIEDHTPSPEPLKYEKKGGDWYNQDDMVIKDGPQDTGVVQKRRRTYSDSLAECKAETEYLRTARKGGGHKDLLTTEAHVLTPEPIKYEKKDGQWYTHDGVDVIETQARKEMVTLPSSPRPSSAASSIDIETNTDYLKIAKKGGGHKDLLTIDPHTPTPEPVMFDKTDGQWYTHDGVDVKETQQRKDLSANINSPGHNVDEIVAAGENSGDYLKLAKKGGGHQDLLTIDPHSPTPEPVKYDKKDGQWYTHDGVDVKDTQQRKGNFLFYKYEKKDGQWYTHDGVDVIETQARKEMVTLPGSPRPSSAASSIDIETNTDYLKIAKKGGGHKDLLTIDPHTPTPEPVMFDKTDGQWYTHDGVDVKETQQRKDLSANINSPGHNVDEIVAAGENSGDYLKLAKKGGGHQDLLTIDPHSPTPEPVKYDKKDGQWYTHDGVDVKDTQQRKEMVTVASSPRPENSSMEVETETQYLKIAKKGGGHKELLTVQPHSPTSEPVTYDKRDGQWYTHDGVDVKDTQQRKELAVTLEAQHGAESLTAAGGNNRDYLDLAKKGGGHTDLLTIDPHSPTPEPVSYDKTDGLWYTHDGVNVKDTQQRKESTVSVEDQRNSEGLVAAGGNNREYLELAKKGGGHEDLLTIEPHTPTPEPVKYDKTDGQWYTHDGVDVKETQQRRDLSVTLESIPEDLSAAGEINGEYLKMAKKGGRKDLLAIEPHTPTPEPVRYDKKDGQWYTHDGVDVKDTQQRKEMVTVVSSPRSPNLDTTKEVETETDYLKIAKKGGGHKDLLTIEPHSPTPEPVKYNKEDGQWYTHDGVDVKDTQQRKEMVTVSASPRPASTESSVNIEIETDYLKIAKKGGGHKDLLTIEPHTPTPEPVKYDKTDGQWYTHDGVDVKETQQRRDLSVTLESIPEDLSAAGEINGEYLKMAKKGGRKDLLAIEPHTPTPEPVRYDKKDGQWYTHDGVDVKDTQQRKEMVTVVSSPRSPNLDTTKEVETETDYLKIAKKGGGHKDLLTIEPHSPTPEPVKYNKEDGQWYTHDGVDVKDTQQRKEMVTVSSSPRPTNLDSSVNVKTDTEYLKIAKKGGGHKDLLTMEPHTPSPEPQRYQKNGGDWYNQNSTDTPRSSAPPSPRKNNSDDIDYLILARKGGGHSDLLTIEPHTPTPEPVKYDKKDGQWYTHDGVDVKDTQQRRDQTPSSRRSPRKNTRDSKLDINTNTEYLKIARKGGGHKDLLTHTPSPEPQRYENKADQNNHDSVDGNKTRDRKGSHHQNGGSSVQINTETEYLKTARKGGGHKDLLTIEHHKPSPKPKKQESKLGDWYYQDGSVVKERKESPSSSPRKTSADNSPATTEYLKMARKGGGRKDLLMMTPDKASPSPKPKEAVKRNTDSTPISSPRNGNGTSRDSTDYLRLARKGGGHTDLLSSAPRQAADSFNAVDSPRRKEPSTDFSLRRSASMRHRGPVSDYLSTARKGGHHKDLLTMPETSNFKRDQESRRSLRSFRSPVISQVDGPSRPRTAEPRQSHPIWLGGSGPERTHSPGKRFINQNSRFAPFAYHEGSPGAAKNPDKI
ncbi:uncharacterized protein LOC110048011 [Orbicella faveolata]|uniref:uncharacterized protein LOC110048011 n=1 Tax=Orbicella faveolata TaxID=48498 RepID=UPI0009E360DF|nr:uncharacterized protein LOC110048011 [Orbicella faveolata]